jgi:hypothetical protein
MSTWGVLNSWSGCSRKQIWGCLWDSVCRGGVDSICSYGSMAKTHFISKTKLISASSRFWLGPSVHASKQYTLNRFQIRHMLRSYLTSGVWMKRISKCLGFSQTIWLAEFQSPNYGLCNPHLLPPRVVWPTCFSWWDSAGTFSQKTKVERVEIVCQAIVALMYMVESILRKPWLEWRLLSQNWLGWRVSMTWRIEVQWIITF